MCNISNVIMTIIVMCNVITNININSSNEIWKWQWK